MNVSLPLSEAPHLLDAGYSPTGFKSLERSRQSFWQFHLFLYRGRLRENLDTVSFDAESLCLTPPGKELVLERPRQSPHYYVHFKATGRNAVAFPRIWKSEWSTNEIVEILSDIVRRVHTQPARSRARFWELLWRLADSGKKNEPKGLPRGLESALHYLEKFSGTSKPVSFLSERTGYSAGHLTRLFRKFLGTTPTAWRRKRLAERAKLLLLESHLSPAQIAANVGLADLQQFNKLMRREYGLSPRAIRGQHARSE